ncbi:hypothetical protein B0T18DRAFT_161618 [Schizothecium vesticola]|uniref:Uncharacterized protein n=1 Tax=Schizothecium vesticola TaxID=314040 RepID=A0AA40EWL6_9PEZI|nr:hypothetical protein B0T18DRAFT_161618 [Schizothecium vesticola]
MLDALRRAACDFLNSLYRPSALGWLGGSHRPWTSRGGRPRPTRHELTPLMKSVQCAPDCRQARAKKGHRRGQHERGSFANSNHHGSPRELSSEGRPEARKRQVGEGRCRYQRGTTSGDARDGCCTCPSWTCAVVSARAVCRLRTWARFALIRRSVELDTHPAIYLCICIRIYEPLLEPPLPWSMSSPATTIRPTASKTGVTARVTGRPTGPLSSSPAHHTHSILTRP